MDMFDEARAMEGTMRLCGLSQRELAKRLGTSQSYVANKLRLLSYSEKDIEKIRKGGITERHARAILRLPDDRRGEMLDRVVKERLTVRECEALVDVEVLPRVAFSPKKAEIISAADAVELAVKKCAECLIEYGARITLHSGYVGSDRYFTVVIKDI